MVDKKNKLEKVVFWVGSLCGIFLSIFAIYEKLTQPSDASLNVEFFESASQELLLTPPINTGKDETEELPLQLRISNDGGKIAKNVKVYISYYTNVTFSSQYKREEKRTWIEPDSSMRQVSLNIEDINPGEIFLIPITLKLEFPREIQRAISRPINEVSDSELLTPRSYPLIVDISSQTSVSQRATLRIILGKLEKLLEQSGDVYWVGHGPGGTTILKAKEDFLYPDKYRVQQDN